MSHTLSKEFFQLYCTFTDRLEEYKEAKLQHFALSYPPDAKILGESIERKKEDIESLYQKFMKL